jgi:hypothetical protein
MWRAILLVLPALLCSTSVARGAEGDASEAPAASATTRLDRRWNLSVGTGAGGFVEFADAFSGTGVGGYDSSRRQDRFQINARIDRELGRWLRVGAAWVYNRWTDAYFSGGAEVGTLENRVHVLMGDATLRWVRSEHLELYSALAVGAGRWREHGAGIAASHQDVTAGPAFQLRYIGIAAGSERVRLFADLGIGFEGLVVGGLLVRL